MARQPAQVPGDAGATSQTSQLPTDSKPLDTSLPKDDAGATDAAAAGPATVIVDAAEWAAMRQSMADMQMMLRRTVETGQAPEVKKLPSAEEVLASNPKTPQLSAEGWVVPPSENWAVTNNASQRKLS